MAKENPLGPYEGAVAAGGGGVSVVPQLPPLALRHDKV